MSFYTDAMGDADFVKGVIKVKIAQGEYVDGEYVITGYKETKITTEKSIQPLDPEDIQKMGFGEYPDYEYYELFTFKELPIPSADLKSTVLTFNKKDYTIKRVLTWKWDSELGYYDYIICRKIDLLNGAA